jgi:hypothetical protein
MACCGQGRSSLSMTGKLAGSVNGSAATPSPVVLYEYTGTTGMTVIGSVTGRSYRFREPGGRVQIDTLDVRSLAGVPNLTRVQGA